jgi:hypothetical protein
MGKQKREKSKEKHSRERKIENGAEASFGEEKAGASSRAPKKRRPSHFEREACDSSAS